MAKESPADKIKRELAARTPAPTIVDPDTGETSVVDTKGALSDEEVQGITAGFADDPKDSSAPSSSSPPVEDPERLAARQSAFERAERFERERAARIAAARSGQPFGNTTALIAPDDPEEDPNVRLIDEEFVAVRMPKDTYDKLLAFAAALPTSTPREHALCGYAVYKITVGMVKDAAGLPRARR